MRIACCCFSVFLATASALANSWLANEADIVAQVKAALPIGLQVTRTGYGDFLFEGISHFYIHIVDDSEPTPKVRVNRAFDAQVVLLPFDFDYADMRNSEELDRFLIARTTTYKALFLAPETFGLLWAATRMNLKDALSGSEKHDGRSVPRAAGTHTHVFDKWREIEKRIVSIIYPTISLQDASIDDVIELLHRYEHKITNPEGKRVPLVFSRHIYGGTPAKITLQRHSIQMSEVLALACAESGLHWQISQNTVFIYDDSKRASQEIRSSIDRHRRDQTDYSGQGVTESKKERESSENSK